MTATSYTQGLLQRASRAGRIRWGLFEDVLGAAPMSLDRDLAVGLLVALAGSHFGCGTGIGAAPPETARPNIVVILSDDQGYADAAGQHPQRAGQPGPGRATA